MEFWMNELVYALSMDAFNKQFPSTYFDRKKFLCTRTYFHSIHHDKKINETWARSQDMINSMRYVFAFWLAQLIMMPLVPGPLFIGPIAPSGIRYAQHRHIHCKHVLTWSQHVASLLTSTMCACNCTRTHIHTCSWRIRYSIHLGACTYMHFLTCTHTNIGAIFLCNWSFCIHHAIEYARGMMAPVWLRTIFHYQ